MRGRFEIVRSDAEQPFHVRKVAGNGEPEWSSEQYADKSSAFDCAYRNNAEALPVVEVDERTAPEPKSGW